MHKTLISIFVVGFVLNFIWEQAHSFLYISYKNAEITHLILLRAALFDAFVIVAFSFPFVRFARYRQKTWLLLLGLVVFALGLEVWAVSNGRWIYKDIMPLIPFLHVGLTPAVQLGFTGLSSFHFARFVRNCSRGGTA